MTFTEHTANTIRHNLLVMKAANEAAGLSGYVRIMDHERHPSIQELGQMAGGDLEGLQDAEVETRVMSSSDEYQSSEQSQRLFVGETVSVFELEPYRIEKGGYVPVDCDWEYFEEHAEFLRGFGLYACRTSHGESRQKLIVVTVLKSPVQYDLDVSNYIDAEEHPVRLAVRSLTQRGDLVAGILEGFPLSLPIFPDDISPEEIVQNALEHDTLIELAKAWELSGRNHDVFAATGDRLWKDDKDVGTKYIVDGLIPNRLVTELVGETGTGKSTIIRELASTASTQPCPGEVPQTWLGQRVTDEKSGGLVAYLTGEDGMNDLKSFFKRLGPDARASALFVKECGNVSFPETVAGLHKLPDLRLVIVDCMSNFISGSENDNDKVNQTFRLLQNLAREKGCAVVVLHHLLKNAQPKSLERLKADIRGAGVYQTFPRVILGIYKSRRDQENIRRIGIVKWNLFQEDKAFEGARCFEFDPETFRHLPADNASDTLSPDNTEEPQAASNGDARQDADDADDDTDAAQNVLAAIKRSIAKGISVTWTGRKSIFGRRKSAPEIEGMTREQVQRAQDALLDQGSIAIQDGRLVVPEALSTWERETRSQLDVPVPEPSET